MAAIKDELEKKLADSEVKVSSLESVIKVTVREEAVNHVERVQTRIIWALKTLSRST
jgi:hypothetical protein